MVVRGRERDLRAEQCNGIQALSTSGSLVALGTVGRPGHCADRLDTLERTWVRSSNDSMSVICWAARVRWCRP